MNDSEAKRQNTLKNVKKLEMELMEKSDIIKTLSGDTSLAIKKYEIKMESHQEEMKGLSEKLQEK